MKKKIIFLSQYICIIYEKSYNTCKSAILQEKKIKKKLILFDF